MRNFGFNALMIAPFIPTLSDSCRSSDLDASFNALMIAPFIPTLPMWMILFHSYKFQCANDRAIHSYQGTMEGSSKDGTVSMR